jgi:hypothetical protein
MPRPIGGTGRENPPSDPVAIFPMIRVALLYLEVNNSLDTESEVNIMKNEPTSLPPSGWSVHFYTRSSSVHNRFSHSINSINAGSSATDFEISESIFAAKFLLIGSKTMG